MYACTRFEMKLITIYKSHRIRAHDNARGIPDAREVVADNVLMFAVASRLAVVILFAVVLSAFVLLLIVVVVLIPLMIMLQE